MLAIDVKDAFLTVAQEQPTRVRCTDASGISISYSLGRVLPGQRDGSLLWHKDLVKFLEGSSLIRWLKMRPTRPCLEPKVIV